MKKITFTSLTD